MDLAEGLTTFDEITFFVVFVSLTFELRIGEVLSLDRMSSSVRMFLVLFENFFVGDSAMTDLAPLADVLPCLPGVPCSRGLGELSFTAGSMVCLLALVEGLAMGAELRLTELLLDLVIRVTDLSSSNIN